MICKKRMAIKWFSVFMAFMLFQTAYMRLGTITAFVSLAGTILVALLYKEVDYKRFTIKKDSVLLVCLAIFTIVVLLAHGISPAEFKNFYAQIILCVVLLALKPLNECEKEYLRVAFVLSALVYAVLTIHSCYQLRTSRYYHDSIQLFHTDIDPNFIGIPFVAAEVLLLDNILKRKKMIPCIVVYMIIAVAIVYTASRGNMLCLVITHALMVLNYLKNHHTRLLHKVFILIGISVLAYYAISYLSTNFVQQWERMTGVEEGMDNGRFFLWKRSVEVWSDNPVWGVGLGGMYRIFQKANHNTYMQLLAETGTVGFVLFMTFLFRILSKLRKKDKTYFFMFLGCMMQVFFLDGLDNRCFWVIICWMVLLVKKEPRVCEARNATRPVLT